MINAPVSKIGSVQGRHNNVWQLQTAKARFSELFRLVRSDGPQRVTRQGKEAVVIISSEQFEKLTKRKTDSLGLVDFFAKSPLTGVDLNLKRQVDYGRDIEL